MIRWYHRLMCRVSRHLVRTVMAFPETGVALRITGCLCGRVHDVEDNRARFPMPSQRVRRIA